MLRFYKATPQPPIVRFRHYVVAGRLSSLQAIANLQTFCRRHLPGRHEIELIDVEKESGRAARDGVIRAPTLIMVDPKPEQTIVGTLDDNDRLHALLDDVKLASDESAGTDTSRDYV